MKTTEGLNAIRAEIESLNAKLAELTDQELEQVAGGFPDSDRYNKEEYAQAGIIYNHHYFTFDEYYLSPLYPDMPKQELTRDRALYIADQYYEEHPEQRLQAPRKRP